MLIKETIENAILSDDLLVWDFVKCCIGTDAISYSIRKNKENNEYLPDLNARLSLLKEKISSTPTTDTLTKNMIENIYNEKGLLDP